MRLATISVFVVSLALSVPAAARAQGGGLPALQAQVNQLQALVVTLQAQVNALAGSAIQLWAQADTTPLSGVGVTGMGAAEINSVSIVAPGDGFLVISGGVAVSNASPSVVFYKLNAKLDGANLYSFGGEAVVQLDAFISNNRSDTLAYTVTAPVTAGPHTVSQTLGSVLETATNFSYSRNNLTVIFVPAAAGTLTAAP